MIAEISAKMIAFYRGSLHDIDHFLKVYAYAKMIGEMEKLPAVQQKILEIAAIVHDIACPLCREKYGNASGKHQEAEGPALAMEFLRAFDLTEAEIQRICYLVGHHHTITDVDGMDYRILLEADYLVNAGESNYSRENIQNALENIFRTESGAALLRDIYLRS